MESRRSPPSGVQITQTAVERGRERDHRPCRQRHAQVAADRRHVPDLERGEKGAAALTDQPRRDPRRGRLESVERRDRAGRRDEQPGVGDAQRRPVAGSRGRSGVEAGLRLRKQPRAAREPGVAVGEGADLVAAPRPRDRRDGVEVHGRPIDEPAGAAFLTPAGLTCGPCSLCAPFDLVISASTARSDRHGEKRQRVGLEDRRRGRRQRIRTSCCCSPPFPGSAGSHPSARPPCRLPTGRYQRRLRRADCPTGRANGCGG